jgi:hypothetical protein
MEAIEHSRGQSVAQDVKSLEKLAVTRRTLAAWFPICHRLSNSGLACVRLQCRNGSSALSEP